MHTRRHLATDRSDRLTDRHAVITRRGGRRRVHSPGDARSSRSLERVERVERASRHSSGAGGPLTLGRRLNGGGGGPAADAVGDTNWAPPVGCGAPRVTAPSSVAAALPPPAPTLGSRSISALIQAKWSARRWPGLRSCGCAVTNRHAPRSALPDNNHHPSSEPASASSPAHEASRAWVVSRMCERSAAWVGAKLASRGGRGAPPLRREAAVCGARREAAMGGSKGGSRGGSHVWPS